MKFVRHFLLLTFLAPAWSEEPMQGHSVHGQSFSEGPRRFATLFGATGDVSFPVTTASAEAQQFFNQGVGQLHGFWYYEAERSFRQALFLDPGCTMAYWGMAMANIENETRAKEFTKKAMAALDKLSKKEKLWIQSLDKFYNAEQDKKKAARDLVRSWEDISEEFPDDIEARAFLAGLIWWNSSRRGIEISSHLAVDALIDQILAKSPNHPAHHYTIHLWDGEKAERALKAAAASGPAAWNIAHMWHMPGHIYNKTSRWQDAAFQQEAAHRMDHRFMLRQATMPDQIHNYAHNAEWLCRTFSQVGRVNDAIAVARNMIEQPLIPRSKSVKPTPEQKWEANNTAYSMGRDRLIDTLVRWELWDQIIDWSSTPYLEAGEQGESQMKLAHAQALAHFRKGNVAEGKAATTRLAEIVQTVKTERQKAADEAEAKAISAKKSAEETNKAMAEAMLPVTRRLEALRRSQAEIQCEQLLAENNVEEAKKVRETLRDKDVPTERRLQLDWRLGEKDKALKAAKDWVNDAKNEVLPLCAYTEVLLKMDQKDEAKKQFEELRKVAGTADLSLPILNRLKVLAGDTVDWRVAPETPPDAGKRAPLAEYGPLQWSAGQAPSWNAVTADNTPISNATLAGKPHVLIFFLGKGCAHCVSQLQAFEPLAQKFAQAGLSLHAISTDTPDGVKATLSLAKTSGGFPFPIYSDDKLGAFRGFHAFDDFETKPLHGTFLIDGTGRLRWQHISFEPFMEGEFLLKEAQRLQKM